MMQNQKRHNQQRRDRISDIIRGHRRLFKSGISTEAEMLDDIHAETESLRRRDHTSNVIRIS